jgi:drug/metabolite transporter (DMT)-like permease
MADPSRSDLSRGYSVALIASFLLSMTAIFIRYLTEHYEMPPLVLAFWRDLFTVLTVLIALALLRPALLRVDRPRLAYLALYGLVLATFNILWTLSVALNGAAVATVLAYSSAAFTALLGWWLLNERLDWAKLLAIAVCLSGCALVAEALNPDAWGSNLGGILAGALTGLAYAGYSLMGRSASQRGLNPWTTVLYTFGFASLYLFALVPTIGPLLPDTINGSANLFWLDDSLRGWLILIALSAGPTIGGFGLYNLSLSYLPSSVANLVLTSEPAFTAIVAYLLLDERLGGTQIAGGLVLLSGVIFLRVYEDGLARRSARMQAEIAAD